MAAKGQESKNIIIQKILDTFEGSFQYEKEIRIPMLENGELVQIKVALTAAKSNVEQGSENIVPAAATISNEIGINPSVKVETTEEERENVKRLLASLNL